MKILKFKDKLSLNILISFANLGGDLLNCIEVLKKKRRVNVLLDSGAFTAYNTGKIINLENYINFLKTPPFVIYRYFTLDVIGKPKETWKNYEKLLKAGLNPIPIFTPGDTFEKSIDKMYKTSDLIGLGGLVKSANVGPHVQKCMFYIKKRKVHWLGFNRFEYIKHYKPSSCDSSSVIAGSKYGHISLCNSIGRFITVTREDFIKRPLRKITQLIEDDYGFEVKHLANKNNWRRPVDLPNYGVMVYLGIMGHVRRALLIEKNLSTKIFHVSNTMDLYNVAKAYDYWMEKGFE